MIAAIFRTGSQRWPDLGVTVEDLERYAARTPLSESAVQHAADVVLVCACAMSVDAAVAELDRVIRDTVPLAVRRVDKDADFASEICQRMRERLFLVDPPRIGTYSGAGPVAGWLRVMAVRLALDVKREARPLQNQLAATCVDNVIAESGGPEIEALKARYGQSLFDAVSQGLKNLPRRQRAVLRLYLLANLSIDEIGRMYSVHRATVARWIASAEQAVFDTVKTTFREQWGLATADVASLARLVRSRLPLSLDDAL